MKEVGVTNIKDALCEVCGSPGFEELLCNCCKCNDCNEHVYCMRKHLQYIPDTWTCDECLSINISSHDHESQFGTNTKKALPGATYIPECDSDSTNQAKRVTPDVPNADKSSSNLLEFGKLVSPKTSASELTNDAMHTSAQVKEFPQNVSNAANSVSHSDNEAKNTPPNALNVVTNGPLYDELLQRRSGNTQTLSNAEDSSDMRVCLHLERGRIDNLDLKMRRLAEELQSLWKKIERSRRSVK